jgi:hypothetical protein
LSESGFAGFKDLQDSDKMRKSEFIDYLNYIIAKIMRTKLFNDMNTLERMEFLKDLHVVDLYCYSSDGYKLELYLATLPPKPPKDMVDLPLKVTIPHLARLGVNQFVDREESSVIDYYAGTTEYLATFGISNTSNNNHSKFGMHIQLDFMSISCFFDDIIIEEAEPNFQTDWYNNRRIDWM